MTIREVAYKSGGSAWMVDLGNIVGDKGKKKRLQKFFSTKEKAEEFVSGSKHSLKMHGHASLALTEDERIRFCGARDRLAAVGATIEKAVEYYFSKHASVKAPLALSELFRRCALEKELAGRRRNYMKQFKVSCRSFIAGREEALAHTVTREDVQRWVSSNGWRAKTQRVYLGDLRTLFSWGMDADVQALIENPAAGKFRLLPPEEGEISSFGPEACETLLVTALTATEVRAVRGRRKERESFTFRSLIGFAALGMFAGIRPEGELRRLSRKDLDLDEATAVVSAGKAKTRTRRPVDLSPNCVRWLRLWEELCPDQAMVAPPNVRHRWDRLRAAAGLLEKWPHDILRHTFASMHFATHKNAATLKAAMGHSKDEDTLERHYRAIRTIDGKTISRGMAEVFWGIEPPAGFA